MKKRDFLVIITILLSLIGCTIPDEGTSEDSEIDTVLIGEWISQNSKPIMTLTINSDKTIVAAIDDMEFLGTIVSIDKKNKIYKVKWDNNPQAKETTHTYFMSSDNNTLTIDNSTVYMKKSNTNSTIPLELVGKWESDDYGFLMTLEIDGDRTVKMSYQNIEMVGTISALSPVSPLGERAMLIYWTTTGLESSYNYSLSIDGQELTWNNMTFIKKS